MGSVTVHELLVLQKLLWQVFGCFSFISQIYPLFLVLVCPPAFTDFFPGALAASAASPLHSQTKEVKHPPVVCPCTTRSDHELEVGWPRNPNAASPAMLVACRCVLGVWGVSGPSACSAKGPGRSAGKQNPFSLKPKFWLKKSFWWTKTWSVSWLTEFSPSLSRRRCSASSVRAGPFLWPEHRESESCPR